MSVINTNITSMIGQQNLRESQNNLQTSMERLSSGLRINSAKDDAAGQAIANRMTAQITGLAQSQRNANDGISVAQTAEGALNQVNDNLQRVRELSVQAQNGTNSQDDLTSIQNEIGQRLNEINRISEETSFNGVQVLASDQGLKIQVGANDGEAITVNLEEINAKTLGLDGFNVDGSGEISNKDATITDLNNLGAADNGDGTYDVTTAFEKAEFSDVLGKMSDGNTVAIDSTNATPGPVYTFNADSNDFTVTQTAAADDAAAVTALENEIKPSSGTKSGTYEIAGGDVVDFEVDSGGNLTIDGQTAYLDAATGVLTTNDPTGGGGAQATLNDVLSEMNDSAAGTDATMEIGGTKYTAATGAISYDETASVEDVEAALNDSAGTSEVTLGGDGTTGTVTIAAGSTESTTSYLDLEGKLTTDTQVVNTYAVSQETGEVTLKNDDGGPNEGDTVYVGSDGRLTTDETSPGERTEDPLATLDSALNQVDALRSDLGAIQNRFESAITNLSTNETNLSAARSRIEDADYATEVANMTRSQILQQAGTSVLAQANQIPQNVLSLLG